MFNFSNQKFLSTKLRLAPHSKTGKQARSLPSTAVVAMIAAWIFILETAAATPLSGTKSVGPAGDYPSVTAAIADVQAQTLGGALVLELQSNYVSNVETFPLTFNNLPTSTANTLTLRPQLGATNLLISSAGYAAATLDLKGAQFLTIDGRPGGVGTNAGTGAGAASQLTIANTISSGWALRFYNGAGSNTLRYVTFRGANASSSGGVVYFSTTTSAVGNNGNTIDHCDIRDGSSTPICCIYSIGSAAPKNNTGNLVSNCNIYNFYSISSDQYGIRLDGGNSDWTIVGNNFYQTGSQNGPSAATDGGIFVNDPAGNNFVVSSNVINGWGYQTTTAQRFIGIALNVGSATPSSVQGNTIQNFNSMTTLNTSTAPGIWGGITVSAGSANIGTAFGNTVAPNTVTTSGSGGLATGISSTSTGTVVIANNTINSITVSGTTTNVDASFSGITVTAGTNVIRNNSISGITAATRSVNIPGQFLTGILNSSSNHVSIMGNTVINLANDHVGAWGYVHGIVSLDGVNSITGNTVYGLATSSGNASSYEISAVLGIYLASGWSGQTMAQNTVYALADTARSGAVSITGIGFAGSTNGAASLIERNFVHSLEIASTNTASMLFGFDFRDGNFTAQNNMVRVGLGSSGASTANNSLVSGIYDLGSGGARNYYHNSVYLGGSQTQPQTTALRYTAALVGAAGSTYQNNIFVNARSQSGGNGHPYAAYYFGSQLTGLTAGGNLFLVSGTGGLFCHYNGADYSNLAAWQSATGLESGSLVADPLFLAPGGDTSTVNLHIATNSQAINAGLPIGVTEDFDGDLRSALTPAIGADEWPHISSLPSALAGVAPFGNNGSGGIRFNFTNLAGDSFTVLASTDIALPVIQWVSLGRAAETPAGSGQYQFTDLQATNYGQLYYRVRSP